MNLWLAAAAAILFCLIPIAVVCLRGEPIDRLVGLEAAGTVATLDFELLAQASGQSVFFDLPLTLALLAFAGGLVFSRFLERWM